ncbi:M48 family metalloprotease [Pseudorhodoplanes sinuspersici]|uniref:Zn-dependent protease n=1 Tax=Pseudorhodoplanes sinuspersici TaxID=1235591 RepID=A0A1W6ZZU7_9HYPH|nr:M48 family metalloprotease [Pseudorhodoplanes sinuspersici]ARQ02886.1 Zn-dependent protease [Pseudorhodoplanes sinuspersici]
MLSRAYQKSPKAVLTAAALALVLASCSGGQQVGRQITLPDPPVEKPETLTPAQREHRRILAAYGGAYNNPKLEESLNRTVEKLVAASERPDLHYKVTILNSPAINAFALPTGQLYVTRGLLALANDTSELASVLSHEMAHVIARHAAIREDQIRQAAMVNRVASDVLGDQQMGALALAKSKIALATFSRGQEFEADGIGVGISSRAGYDPFGATRFLTSMGRSAELRAGSSKPDSRNMEFLSSHPATPERVANATLNARQYSAPGPGSQDRQSYLSLLDGLTYGEDPSEGFVRGRRFVHPKLGFTFTAPDGFVLENTPQAVFGIKDGGDLALRLDVVRIPADQKLTDYLQSGWIENIDAASIEEVRINGFKGVTGTANGDPWGFRLYAIRFGSEVYRFIFAAKNKTPEIDKHFREAVNSFRRMSVAESRSARPLRLKIVTVGPRDTVEKLASQMGYADRQLERFRVLNGLDVNDKLKPGDLVKLVVE